ncbi:MAG TPA: hypothetical protein VHQ47_01960 [Phycisphaerae bacterium]|nr:hypothetical protein [Phycisphaerae bacterium]
MGEFRVYKKGETSIHTYEGSVGKLGRIVEGVPPLGTMAGVEAAIMFADAWLGREPGDFLYIADERGMVVRIMMNTKHHDAVRRARASRALAIGLLVMCFEALCMGAWGVAGRVALICFAIVGTFYVVLSAFLLNEIEAGMLCIILETLSLLGARNWPH